MLTLQQAKKRPPRIRCVVSCFPILSHFIFASQSSHTAHSLATVQASKRVAKDAIFIHILQVPKGIKLLARTLRLMSPPQIGSLIVQVIRTLPLTTTPVVSLQLSPEAMMLLQNLLARALAHNVERFDLNLLSHVIEELRQALGEDVELAVDMFGVVGGQLTAAIVRRADMCMVATQDQAQKQHW